MLTAQDRNGRRIYKDHAGQEYVGVTSAIKLVGQLLGEPDEFASVPKPLLTMHQLEGEGCHQVCLDWLAWTNGQLDRFEVPPKPELHPDAARWANVMSIALSGFQDWCVTWQVVPFAIEQASVCAKYGLAGRPDLGATVTWKKRRVKAIIDLKRVKTVQRSHMIQVRLYRHLDGFDDCSIGIIFHIDVDAGTTTPVEVYLDQRPEDTAAAISAAQLERWAARNK